MDRRIITVRVSRAHSGTPHSDRTSLGEWSARRRDDYLTTHNIRNRQSSKPLAGFRQASGSWPTPWTARPPGSAPNVIRVTQFINLVSGWTQTGYFIVAAVWVLLLVELNKRPYLRDWLYFVILPPHLGCLIWCNPNRTHHGLDIVRWNYVLIWGKLWREMTSRSNCDVIGFHNAFRGACAMKSAKKRGLMECVVTGCILL